MSVAAWKEYRRPVKYPVRLKQRRRCCRLGLDTAFPHAQMRIAMTMIVRVRGHRSSDRQWKRARAAYDRVSQLRIAARLRVARR